MPDNSLTISCDQGGTSYTATINDALEAINTMRSGADVPVNNLADGTLWLDTMDATKPIIKIRFAGEFRDLAELTGAKWYFEQAKVATALETARDIGGVSFDGTSDIDLPGVNTPGTQATSGKAATAGTADAAGRWTTARSVTLGTDLSGVVTFDGGADVTLEAMIAADTVDTNELNSVIDATPANDAGKVLTLNATGTGLEWSDSPSSLSGGGGGYLLHQMSSGS